MSERESGEQLALSIDETSETDDGLDVEESADRVRARTISIKRLSKRERAASGGGDERRKELLGRLMSVHAAFRAKRPLSKVYHRPELIESERTRVKEWFRARIDALDATENSEAAE